MGANVQCHIYYRRMKERISPPNGTRSSRMYDDDDGDKKKNKKEQEKEEEKEEENINKNLADIY